MSTRRAFLAALTALLAARAPGAAPRKEGPAEVAPVPLERVVDVLARCARAPPGARGDALAEFVALGPGAAGPLFALLAGRVTPEDGAALAERDTQLLLVQVLKAWPPDAVTALVSAEVGAPPALAEALLAFDLLGQVGEAAAVDAVLGIAEGLAPVERQHPLVAGRVAASLGLVLLRDPSAPERLSRRLAGLPPELLGAAVEALAGCGDAASVRALRALLAREELLVPVIDALGRSAPWVADNHTGATARALTPYLGDADPAVRGAAILALGRIGVAQSVDDLLPLLDDPDPAVRRDALWALNRLNGSEWPGRSERWWRWREGEERFREEELAACLQRARARDRATALAAVLELRRHRLTADETLPTLGPLVRAESTELAVAACATLAALRSGAAVPALQQALTDPRLDVRRAGHEALRALTGVDEPPDPVRWARRLER